MTFTSYVIRLYTFIVDMANLRYELSQAVWLLQQFCQLLFYTNFAVNFLLYSACGSTFRQCLYRLVNYECPRLRKIVCGNGDLE